MSEFSDHYARLDDLYQELGWLDGWYCPGNRDFTGWYNTKSAKGDWDGYARPYALGSEYGDLRERLDRVVYSTVNYAPREWFADAWTPFNWGEDAREWAAPKPMPGYGDLMAYAPFADIDLDENAKHRRADGALPREPVEAALREYVEAFAELAAGRQHVYALDSVGGAYIMVAPTATAPLADLLEREDRARLFGDLMDRLNSWLADVRDRVNGQVPEVAGIFEPDLLNNKNRLYKAPLSVHSSLDAVVTPMDTAAPQYEYRPVNTVSKDLISEAFRWADGFTADHREAVGPLMANLYPEYSDDPDAWRSTARERVANLKEKEEQRQRERERRRERRENRDVDPSELETTTNLDDVKDAIDRIDPEDVVRELCADWDTAEKRIGPTRFEPRYRTSESGTSCYVGTEKEVKIVDLKDEESAIGVVDYVARETHWISVGPEDTATGRDWWRAVDELRRMGYDIPRLVDPQAGDMSEYYHYDLDSVAQRHGSGDPFEDATALLRACLAAREENPELEDAKPPYKALVVLAERFDLQMADPEERILGKAGHKFAIELFGELTLADLDGSKVPAD